MGYLNYNLEKVASAVEGEMEKQGSRLIAAAQKVGRRLYGIKNINPTTPAGSNRLIRRTVGQLRMTDTDGLNKSIKAMMDRGMTEAQALRAARKATERSLRQGYKYLGDLDPNAATQQFRNDMFWAPKRMKSLFNFSPLA